MKPRLMLALASVLFLATSSASAEATQIRTPVTFTLAGCTQLPAGVTVTGSGESFVVMTSRADQDGNIVIVRNDLVTGTAVDSNGAVYSFNYHNHSIMTVPPAGFPVSVALSDHFNLVGNGKANQLQVHFVANLTVFSFSPFIASAEFKNTHGDPSTCDPI